ncbi:tetratricopeptide repeat protein 14 homolog isoform X2 [Cylas formicarius]|uniref:tetratricopeptide repeat protein 14 homolog isoform X2 n=1 Tax=Cylas formicarius TaxID=197179 RepID=UPI0029587C9E|nr:tetratricopeptide repeat protein 14 homolog isoform X2 [Cylas formicarius]
MTLFNAQLLTKTINFHGQQIQKLWESEYGEHDLVRRNIKDLNFHVYGQRQKSLSFQDRGKRLKLQQFIVKKADLIFTMLPSPPKLSSDLEVTEDMYAITPPFEIYVNAERQKRLQFFTENVKIGDLILGTIVSKQQSGMMLKVLCTTGNDGIKYAADINIKAFCPVANVIPAVDKKGVSRSYMMNDYVCCEVLEVIADTDKMVCGMKGVTRKPGESDPHPPLGLISTDDFPLVYKKSLDHKNESFDSVLEKSIGFNNPNNIQFLSEHMGVSDHISIMNGLKSRFPENEYAVELRQIQASKWAYRNVADGIDHFKAGKHVEAFQCLNKALNIDPRNVEGLVARGALYANSGNFQKAIEDFETALKLNPSHANARKYMGETLVALGRSYEEENNIEEARKAYQSCLSIIPYHEEAKNSLEFLKNKEKQASKNLIEPGELLLPNLPSVSKQTTNVNDALKQLLKDEEAEKKEKKKKKKTKKRKNKRHSSSSSSSSSSGSGDSSSSSSSSSSESSSSSGDSEFKKRKKHRSRSHRREKHENSLSPLSKRMAMMDAQSQDANNFNFNKPASSAFDFSFEEPQKPKPIAELDYENKVKTFLLETKDDSDYEAKVRKFLEESAKWKKGKSDDKKKKKKKDKKVKKESKKKKRKEKEKLKRKSLDLDLDDHKKLRDAIKKELSKEKKKKHSIHSDDEEYFLKSGYSKRFIESLPDLEELESKLNAYYALEKESKRSEISESPKHSMLDSPSPTREQKARQAVAEAAASAGKWKMHIGPPSQAASRFKKKQSERPPSPEWHSESAPEKMKLKNSNTGSSSFDEPSSSKRTPLPPPQPAEKAVSVRKQMAMKEPPPKRSDSPKKMKPMAVPPLPPGPKIPQGQVVLDKFGNFRLMTPPEMKKSHDLGQLLAGRRPPEPPGRPRSDSRSPKRRSRSRSKFSRSRSTSMSRSRSRSYNSRSRSRSRSYSGERRFRRRGGFRGGNRYDRGTYYKPRYPNPRHNDQRGRGRGGYYNRDSRYDRDYRGRGRPYPYNNRGRRPPRGRFGGRGGYREYRDRRYDRSRSRDRSRSFSRSPERSDDETAKKNRAVSKEKLNKYSDGAQADLGQPVRHDGPLSEGEDRDDYNTNNDGKVVDKDTFAGKWADKEDTNQNKEPSPPGSRDISDEVKV